LLIAALRHSLTVESTSQSEAARAFGVKPVTVSRWLAGKSPINVERILRFRSIAKHFVRCLALAERRSRVGET
jgi:transcriptional regulator with XRE-family HTH domain